MVVSEIKLFELLKAKIGEKEAAAFVEILETRVNKKFEDAKNFLSTKEDISKLQVGITEKHNDLLKWMVVMWISQLGAIAALIKFISH